MAGMRLKGCVWTVTVFLVLTSECLCVSDNVHSRQPKAVLSDAETKSVEDATDSKGKTLVNGTEKSLTSSGNKLVTNGDSPPLSEEISKLEFVDISMPTDKKTVSESLELDLVRRRPNLKYNSSKLLGGLDEVVDSANPLNSLSDSIDVSLQKMGDGDLMDPSDLEWMSNIYNPHRWGGSPPGQVTKGCHYNTKLYLKALKEGTKWAAKMADSSGRYSSQFFFGNDFWLGSRYACEEFSNNKTNSVTPPFAVKFHVVKLHILLAKELTPVSRRVFLGICLPLACSSHDIKSILLEESGPLNSTLAQSTRSLEVITVRPVPGEYSLFADPKFHILGCVTAVMVVFMIAGSCFETMLSYRKPKCFSRTKDVELDEGENNNEVVNTKKTVEEQEKIERASKPGVLGQCILSFSVISNCRKILSCKTPEDSLTPVHGLRFLSLAWVIMVHTYLQVFAIAENKYYRTVTERNFMFQTISNATFSVDTFFFISGLLVTFLYFKTAKRANENAKRAVDTGLKASSVKFVTLIGYRFVRLTPAYLFVLGMVELSMRWIRNNSVFEPLIIDELNCANYWWRNALYINSLFPRKDMCMMWSWYMANDTQFYVLGIFLLLLAMNHFKFVVALLVAFLVSTWCTTAYIAVQFQYQARIQEPFALFDELYDKPWTRLGPYLVGMVTGYILFKTKCTMRIPKYGVVLGWVLSLLCLLSLVYGLLHVQPGVATSAAYVALGHTAWGVALGWIVIACCSGYGGIVNTLLSYHALYPLSRLTYCAYLVHPMIMVLTSFQMDGPLHLHNGIVLILYLGNVVASFLLSFAISLAFEAPVVRLLKISMTPRKKDT